MRFMLRNPILIQVILLFCMTSPPLHAGDWPQILGPNRNGIAVNEQLLDKWPSKGPRLLWSKRVGQGFAGPAVADGKVIVFHRVDERERVDALDSRSGDRLWSTDFPADYRGGINPDSGPRCVPLIDRKRDRVLVYGAGGNLHCLALSSGKKIWSRAAKADFRADDGYFGVGSTPLLAGDRVLVNVGGFRDEAGIVAFALDTGKTIWQATKENASYSSPILAEVARQPVAVFVTRLNAIGLEPSSGKVRFQMPFGMRGPTVNAATPLFFQNHLFLSASYGVGARLVKLDSFTPETVWSNDNVMSSQYATCVLHDGFLYGTDGREDIGRATLRCVEALTGQVRWSVEEFGVAHVILAGNKLLLLQIDGNLVISEANSRRFRRLDQAQIFDATARALPALSQGRLYARDTSTRGDELKCLLVGQTQ